MADIWFALVPLALALSVPVVLLRRPQVRRVAVRADRKHPC